MLYRLSYYRNKPSVRIISTHPDTYATLVEAVGRAGFEPTKASPTDLQSAPVDRFGISPKKKKEQHFQEPMEGVEPTTC